VPESAVASPRPLPAVPPPALLAAQRAHWVEVADAWADGTLGEEDAAELRAAIEADPAVTEAERARLLAWLDPLHPPAEGARVALRAALHPPTAVAAVAPLDPAALTRLLDGRMHALCSAVRAELAGPAFARRLEQDREAYMEQVAEWVRRLAAKGWGALAFPRECGGEGDLEAFMAVFETVALHDYSLAIKFGVQFGLFGGSILQLGTERHHQRYLPAVGRFELPGCFAMSELAHGSNVRDLETTATYDRAAREFVVHTPRPAAHKEWIGNAARHGRLATVFAQLVVDGTNHGVHALLVPLREPDGTLVRGVRIEDDGPKAGLNGVDNGRIWFDHVRVPRENLLDRYGEVEAGGTYTSPIANPSRRFFTMLSTLVGGRITIAASALSQSKVGLVTAVRYANRRRQFGPPGSPEVPLLDYLTHQRRLLPRLAAAYGIHFALQGLVRRFVAHAPEGEREVEVLAAGLKATATWHAVQTLQQCRECCGGQGYLAANRLPGLRDDVDISATFEGDNTVLMQLVAKGLLTGFRQQMGGVRGGGLLRYLGRRASARLATLNPLVTRRTDPAHLRDAAFHGWTLRYREERLLAALARRLKRRLDDGFDAFEALVDCQDHALHLAQAAMERVVLREFRGAIGRAEPGLAGPLQLLADLYALDAIERDLAWFLEKGVVEPVKAEAVRREVNALCRDVRPYAESLADGFGVPDALLPPIAFTGTPGVPDA